MTSLRPLLLLTALAALPFPAIAQDEPLRRTPVPLPEDLGRYVRDVNAAVALGKALYWDEQVGSDGRVSCATCHYAGGGDIRFEEAIHPGPNGRFEESGTRFPFESDDVLGSPGVALAEFLGVVPGQAVEQGLPLDHPLFGTRRQVTGRNAQSTVNAIFSRLQFWDGRASDVFNGVNEAGSEDPEARVLEASQTGRVRATRVAIQPASLASQAVGPVLSEVEMSFRGRTFRDVGRKLLSLQPLGLQEVHPEDGVLGRYRDPSGRGLNVSYAELVQRAFARRWWDSDALVNPDLEVVGSGQPGPGQFTMMETNFSLYWGLSILLYESTLVSGQSRYDRFLAGNQDALSQSERRGLELYFGQARCDQCHDGSELSNASIFVGGGREFSNTAVRPVAEDPGRGAGEFKSVTARLTELNGPYFHTGGYQTLRQVIDFYDQGGAFPGDDTDSQMRELGLSERDKNDLVAFLLSLTDERARFQRAPFDHPSLDIPGGLRLPAVGRTGGPAIPRFQDADPFAR